MKPQIAPWAAALMLAMGSALCWAEPVSPKCPEGGTLAADKKACTLTTEASCTAARGKWAANACDQKLTPTCPGATKGITFNDKTGACEVDTSIPTSEPGAFTGDTLEFPIKDLPSGVEAGEEYCVLGQTTGKEPSLTMIKGKRSTLSCKADANLSKKDLILVPVKDLESTGYKRYGWTYGALFLPYKYRLKDKEFGPSGQLGPYLGYRTNRGDYAINVIGTVAYGPITTGNGANSPTSTNTPSVKSINGLAMAIGFVGALGKGASPFQFGVVWGMDKVSASDRAAYPYTGRHWLALQLGYDWTAGN